MTKREDVLEGASSGSGFARELWRRQRAHHHASAMDLGDVAARLDLLITGVFGRSWPLRIAEAPAPPGLWRSLFLARGFPRAERSVPATDGEVIWLPSDARLQAGMPEAQAELHRFRVCALQQAARAARGAATLLPRAPDGLTRALYLLLEAHGADAELVRVLPGLTRALVALRERSLLARPPLSAFAAQHRPLEWMVRQILRVAPWQAPAGVALPRTAEESLQYANILARRLRREHRSVASNGWLFRDVWIGDLKSASRSGARSVLLDPVESTDVAERTARLLHDRQVHEAGRSERGAGRRGWTVRSAQSRQDLEDANDRQPPMDLGQRAAAQDIAEPLHEPPRLRLTSTRSRAPKHLLPEAAAQSRSKGRATEQSFQDRLAYPEWDYRSHAYRFPGASVRLLASTQGDPNWVARVLDQHRAMLADIRRRFEMLRARRMRLRKQLDGEEIDLDAYIDSYADFRAGLPMGQALYQTLQPNRRDLAIALLIDVSGSTEAWVSQERRIIDVEREALLLVCVALNGLNEPYCVHAFSGEG
ncbi:MAG TPA: hypothetical protein VFB54_14225, partial [Burkholderiales bacterium]|nr:hypothetical protein [Burkholderiales bacterium]